MKLNFYKDKTWFAGYVSPPPAMVSNDNNQDLMERGYELAKECGLNLVYGYYEKMPNDSSDVKKALMLADKYDVKYLVSDRNLSEKETDLNKFLTNSTEYDSYPAFLGNFYFDEPGYDNFGVIMNAKEFYKHHFSERLLYTNLQPMTSPSHYLKQGMWTSANDEIKMQYREYVDSYLKMVKPSVLSYDLYPFKAGYIDDDNYFVQLSLMRNIAERENLPLWVYIQTCSWDASVSRVPKYNEVLWQFATSMCYGATGFQCFCYWTPYSNSANDSDVAMVNFQGNPTERFDAVKEAIRVTNVFMPLVKDKEYKGIMKSGNSPMRVPQADMILLDCVESCVGDAICAVFEDEQKTYVYVVANWTTDKKRDISIYLTEKMRFESYMEGKFKTYIGKSVTKNLSGGESFMVVLPRTEITKVL